MIFTDFRIFSYIFIYSYNFIGYFHIVYLYIHNVYKVCKIYSHTHTYIWHIAEMRHKSIHKILLFHIELLHTA